MATTKLWHVKNNSVRSSNSIIQDTIAYAINEEKTKLTENIFVDEEILNNNDAINEVVKYVVNSKKTTLKTNEFNKIEEVLVSGLNCNVKTADDEFMLVKKRWSKNDGILLYHGVQSFKPGEVNPLTAHEIGVKLANKMWGEKYQVVVTTHCDRKHIHNHIVINSVSFIDGKKYHHSQKDIYRFRQESDNLCAEYGLSIIDHPKDKGDKYNVWDNTNSKTSKRQLIKEDIDLAISNSTTLRQVYLFLENNLGYTVNTKNKYVTLTPPGSSVSFRLDNIDKSKKYPNKINNYTEEAIVDRLLNIENYDNTNKTQFHNSHNKYVDVSKKLRVIDLLDTAFANSTRMTYLKYHNILNKDKLDFETLVEFMFADSKARSSYWRYYYKMIKPNQKLKQSNVRKTYNKYFYLLKNMDYFKTCFPNTHYSIRSEARTKMKNYSQNIAFLSSKKLITYQDVLNYRDNIKTNIKSFNLDKKEVTCNLRLADENKQIIYQNELKIINTQLAELQTELKICNRLLNEYVITAEKENKAEKDFEETQNKHQKDNERNDENGSRRCSSRYDI